MNEKDLEAREKLIVGQPAKMGVWYTLGNPKTRNILPTGQD